jgi:hypothetical protein
MNRLLTVAGKIGHALIPLAVSGTLSCLHAAIVINPTFNNTAGQTWTTDEMGVVNQAIADWSSRIVNPYTLAITFDFTTVTGSYLAQASTGVSYSPGDNVTPWYSGTSLTIHFNTYYFSGANYLWWDSTPATSGDQPLASWDALSVTRHELGHALGFNTLYAAKKGSEGEVNYWTSHITGTTFDPGGLNVALAASDNLAHLADSGTTIDYLMTPALTNGERRDISPLELNMLSTALGYTVVPEPMSTMACALTLGVVVLGRRWLCRGGQRRSSSTSG